MKIKLRSVILVAGLAACLGSTLIAATPGTSFTYQGVLKNNGTPVGSSVNVTFRLFDAATGGTQVGSSIVRSVTPDEGVFSESLDFGESAFAANQALWIEIEVDGDLLGRQALEASPFALNTRGITVATSGRVGFGTDDPGRQLHVRGTSGVIRIDRSDFEPAIDFHDYDDSDDTFQGPAVANWYMSASDTGFSIADRSETPVHRFWIDRSAAGNVGIGTTDPQQKLQVEGSIRMGTGASTDQYIHTFCSSGNWYAGTNNLGNGTSGNQYYIYDGISGSYVMTMQGGTGRVGIGTKTPTTMLDVNGAVTIRGGADIVEGFDASCGSQIEPGTLMVIDPRNPGKLMPSSMPYDGKVAGIVSGANGVKPGIKLGQDGLMDGDIPIAMTGRVYVKCSTENGAIQPGDLLTTAALSGHAMRATDRDRWDGAVIGKAMSTLSDDTGMVLVLVNLQ